MEMKNKYNVIYADPPWSFNNKNTGGSMKSGSESQYPVMSIEDIKSLPVESIAADDCVLLMWWVGSQPQEALDVVEAWGFTLKTMTALVWVKLTKREKMFFGMGFWTRAGSESCLIATKGKPKPNSHSVRSVRKAIVGRHSEKPKEFHDDIVALCGDVPRIELFAREKAAGWDCWGNEVDSDI
ncbi:MAG: adenine methylase [Gammaproteobacteria bacterium]|nr:adenine methylase [Gammaproteobacteria bacterium]